MPISATWVLLQKVWKPPQPVMPLDRTVIFDLQSWSFQENNNSGLSFPKPEDVWDKGGKLKSACMIGSSLVWKFAESEPQIYLRALGIKMYLSCWLKADLMLYSLGRNTDYLHYFFHQNTTFQLDHLPPAVEMEVMHRQDTLDPTFIQKYFLLLQQHRGALLRV